MTVDREQTVRELRAERDAALARAERAEEARALRARARFREEVWPDRLMLESAWGLIANAWGGDWGAAPAEWREAAEGWRDSYHDQLRAAAK